MSYSRFYFLFKKKAIQRHLHFTHETGYRTKELGVGTGKYQEKLSHSYPVLSKYHNYQFKLGKCQRPPPQHEKFASSYG